MSDRDDLLAKALAEYIDLQAQGEPIDVHDFCRKYPEIGAELREHLDTLEEIDTMVEPPKAAGLRPVEPLPEKLSGHKILSEIGSGGMGRVLLALDERLGRQVAIKTLSPRYQENQHVRARFLEEARAMARLSHPHVVRIYHLGPPDEDPHFVMEYVEGVPLTEATRALTLHQKVELMHKVTLAADFLHQHQVIHRDLKPGNILVGPDLEPKVLDFGLALQVDHRKEKLTWAGEILGTPQYFSPEQARAEAPLDARSDVFSLGVVFYELLTGIAPFQGETLPELLESVCERDPVLPRRINPDIPGELQNICLKALEKRPADRYASAREMAQDLERFLAGEPVLAAPTAYSRLMGGKIEQHLRELKGWREDEILSVSEYDVLRKGYGRLVEREDAWIMEVRRLSMAQVSLYLGAWILVVGAALLVLFRYSGLSGTPAVLVAAGAAAPTAYIGIRCWQQGRLRIAVAYLLAFCLLLPIVLVVAMSEYGLFPGLSQNNEKLEFLFRFSSFKRTTNAQLWWSILLSLPAYYWLRRFTRSSVFSLVFAVMSMLLCLVTLLRMGMLEWLDSDPGKLYFRLIPVALLFFGAGIGIERLKHPADSRYFHPMAVAFTLVALSGVATFHEPYAKWLQSAAPWTRGQVEYLFIINAGIYLVLQSICERFPSEQMRWVAKSFRFVIPGHVLTSMLLLGLEGSQRWQEAPARGDLRFEARTFEVLLPCAACAFVFGSIPKQMKNFFATGMLFLAVGIVRLQQDLFKDRGAWPLVLLLAGLALMFAAANYAGIRMAISRWTRRSS
jgi:protein kinase-like protein